MVMECKMVSSRIISIRLAGKPKNLTTIQVYLPTTFHSDSEIEQLYDELEKTTQENQWSWNVKWYLAESFQLEWALNLKILL